VTMTTKKPAKKAKTTASAKSAKTATSKTATPKSKKTAKATPTAKTAKRPTKSKRAPLTRDTVLAAALAMADDGGLAALSMRSLAGQLRVEAMSLYNHVADKEGILDGLVELVAGEVTVPVVGGEWRHEMRVRAHSLHEALMRHPWAAVLFVSRVNVGPNMLRLIDASVGCLHEAGFSWPMSDHAWCAIDAHVHGFTLQRLNFPLQPEQYAAAAAQFLPLIPAETYPHMRALSEEVIARRHDGLQHLDLGLDLLLDGFEAIRVAELTSSSFPPGEA
jgi:AcrR family transcriptional regulator